MNELLSKRLSIKQWNIDDRPREKMLVKGKTALSNAELIANVIGMGSREESAVDLAKRVLLAVNNDLNRLSKMSIADLKRFSGIGEVKAVSIL